MGPALLDNSPVHIFRRIWASKEGSKDWRQHWTSFSLYDSMIIIVEHGFKDDDDIVAIYHKL